MALYFKGNFKMEHALTTTPSDIFRTEVAYQTSVYIVERN
jgi:hypothetical protein